MPRVPGAPGTAAVINQEVRTVLFGSVRRTTTGEGESHFGAAVEVSRRLPAGVVMKMINGGGDGGYVYLLRDVAM